MRRLKTRQKGRMQSRTRFIKHLPQAISSKIRSIHVRFRFLGLVGVHAPLTPLPYCVCLRSHIQNIQSDGIGPRTERKICVIRFFHFGFGVAYAHVYYPPSDVIAALVYVPALPHPAMKINILGCNDTLHRFVHHTQRQNCTFPVCLRILLLSLAALLS